MSVHQILEAIARQYPRRIAIQTETDCWTYEKLNAEANRIANRLLRAGATRGCLVGLYAQRSASSLAAILGILKSGGAYVPLDVGYPNERLRYLLEDTGLRYLVAEQGRTSRLSAILRGVETVIELGESEGAEAQPDVPSDVTDLAYVMYTSGSTGKPKGVMIEHRGIIRLVRGPNYVTISPEDVFLQVGPLSFDASTFEIWGALLNGARLTVPPPGNLSLIELAQVIESFRVTNLLLTAGLFNALVDEYPECLKNVKQLLTGGDVLSPVHVGKAMDYLEAGILINVYGPTEDTTFSCCHRIRREDTLRPSIPIGRPVNKTDVHILDQQLHPVQGQESGEIYLGGEGQARGYLNRPELTREAFVKNPFSSDASARLYRSGDLGHYDAEGLVNFDGRADLQVKIRGVRIELPEIEAAICSFPGIKSAAVIVKQGRTGDKLLDCFFVSSSQPTVRTADLPVFLRQRLPEHMIPVQFTALPALPLTSNGKIDRKQLLQRSAECAAEPSVSDMSTTATEAELLGWTRTLLQKQNISVEQDLFELGLNSLLAARLFAQIDRKFGKRLPLTVLLRDKTIRRLAAVIESEDISSSWSSLVPLRQSGSRTPFFITHAIGGNVVGYHDLAERLPADQPVYALQARGLDGQSSAANSVEEMAAYYIDAIRTVQPEGPYFLGGWSAGALVAFEMACQLSAAGQAVPFLAIFDAGIASYSGRIPIRQRLTGLARRNWFSVKQIGPKRWLLRKLRNVRLRFYLLIHSVTERVSKFRNGRNGYKLNAEQAFRRAILYYKPGVFDGDAVVFRTPEAEYLTVDSDPTLGWGRIVRGKLSFFDIPGNHDDIFTPSSVGLVVEGLNSALENAAAQFAENSSQREAPALKWECATQA